MKIFGSKRLKHFSDCSHFVLLFFCFLATSVKLIWGLFSFGLFNLLIYMIDEGDLIIEGGSYNRSQYIEANSSFRVE